MAVKSLASSAGCNAPMASAAAAGDMALAFGPVPAQLKSNGPRIVREVEVDSPYPRNRSGEGEK